MISNICAFLILSIFSLSSYAGISIVSDLDDTIKITNSGNILHSSYRGVFKTSVFTGMPQLLAEMRNYTNELHIVTASPDIIRSKVIETLNKHSIKYESLIMRSIRKPQGKFDYKVAKIKEIMEKNSDDFIFLGDDVGMDPEVYVEITRLYPNRVLESYIHVINNREIPKGVTKVFAAHDMAILEHSAGRMNEESTRGIVNKILGENSLKMIIPNFAYCPASMTDVWSSHLGTVFSTEAFMIFRKLTDHCHSRLDSNVISPELELASISP